MSSKRKPDDPFYVPPVVFLTEDERMEKLRSMPRVVIHERDPAHTEWTFEPWVRVRPGIDPHKLAERCSDSDCTVPTIAR